MAFLRCHRFSVVNTGGMKRTPYLPVRLYSEATCRKWTSSVLRSTHLGIYMGLYYGDRRTVRKEPRKSVAQNSLRISDDNTILWHGRKVAWDGGSWIDDWEKRRDIWTIIKGITTVWAILRSLPRSRKIKEPRYRKHQEAGRGERLRWALMR